MASAGEQQQWAEVRMIMRRLRNGNALVTITHRTVRGQRVWDRRLDQVEIDMMDDDGIPLSVTAVAIRAALALSDRRSE